MMRRSPSTLWVLFLLLTAFCPLPSVFSQSATATLSGTVEDANGAVIPGATVTVENVNTSLRRQTTTNGEGYFTVPLLPPSAYTVRVEGQGFSPAQLNNVVLNVGDQKSLQIQLKTGNLSEMVRITADAPLINESATVGTVVDRQFVSNLPLNGRSFQSLFELTPGVVLTKTGSEKGQFSVNGQRGDANYFTVDGVSANIGTSSNTTLEQSGAGTLPGFNAFGGTNNLVSVDALQEFKIQTSTYAPEFGRTPGGQVSIVTRSGTNQFHGTLFEYFRNDALDANDWFANQKGLKRPPLRQNDFGGVLGGPILKNRTFFFFSYEGLRLRQPKVATTQVPSLVARQNASSAIQTYLNAYPVPNGRDLGNNIAESSASYADASTLNATSIRIDHTLSSTLALFGRYNNAPSGAEERAPFGVYSANTVLKSQYKTQTLTGGVTWAISPSISDDFHANWSESNGATRSFLDNFGGAKPPQDSDLFPPFTSSKESVFALVPLGVGNGQLSVGKNATNTQRQVNIVNSLVIIKASHTLKFGVDYRRLSPVLEILKYQLALIFFSGINGVLTGRADLAALSGDAGPRFPIFNNFSAFAQDTWKSNHRLTLTYGVRWDVNPPPSEKNGNDPFTVTGLDNPTMLTLASRGTPLYKTTYNNFGPRIGVAYLLSQRPGRESVVRGGFGLFYDLGTAQTGGAFSRFPYTINKTVAGVSLPPDPAVVAIPAITLNPPFASMQVFDPNLKLPRTYQWNVAVEQSLGPHQTVSASYVAAMGRRLLRNERLVNPNPNFTTVNVGRNTATSDYHALQLQCNRRLSHGLQATAFYTWSHSIDIASSDFAGNLPSFRVDPRRERASSDFDIRHSFSGALSYGLPTFAEASRVAKALISRWSIDAIYRARSAAPVNVVTGKSLFGISSPPVGRPNLIIGVPLYLQDPLVGGGRRINPAAFSLPLPGQQGSLGRNSLRGFSLSQLDLAVRRQLDLTERVKLQLKVEIFNLFNHPNFGDPGFGFSNTNALNNALFGRSTVMYGRSLGNGGLDGGFNPLYQVGGPRSIQLSLKLHF